MKRKRTPEEEVSVGLARVLGALGTKRDTNVLRDRYGRGMARLSKEGRVSTEQRAAVSEVFDLLASPTPPTTATARSQVVPLVGSLVRLRLPDVAEVLFLRCLAGNASLADGDVIPAAPTVAAMRALTKKRTSVKAWIRDAIAKRASDFYPTPIADLAVLLLDAPSVVDITRAAVFGRPRPGHLASPELLGDAGLRSDRKAAAFHKVASGAERPDNVAFRYWRVMAREPKRLLVAADTVTTRYVRGRGKPLDDVLLAGLAAVAVSTSGEEATVVSLAVARTRASVAAASALRKWSAETEVAKAMEEASKHALDRILSERGEDEALTWCLASDRDRKRASSQPGPVPIPIAEAAASELARSVRRVARGEAPGPVLDALLSNLGLERLGSERESEPYDPLRHEVKVGDVLPGEPVRVIFPGWRLGKRILMRALAEVEARE